MTPHDWFTRHCCVSMMMVLWCFVMMDDEWCDGWWWWWWYHLCMAPFPFERFVGFVKRRLLHSCGFWLFVHFFALCFFPTHGFPYTLMSFDSIPFNDFPSHRYLFVQFASDDLCDVSFFSLHCVQSLSIQILMPIYELSSRAMHAVIIVTRNCTQACIRMKVEKWNLHKNFERF